MQGVEALKAVLQSAPRSVKGARISSDAAKAVVRRYSQKVQGRAPMTPTLLTFDIFGTVVDWRAGLRADPADHRPTLREEDFDRVVIV